jgi:hypothetical protein
MKKLLFTGLLAVSLSAQDTTDPKATIAKLLKVLQMANNTTQSVCQSYQLLSAVRNPDPTEAEQKLAEKIQKVCAAENRAIKQVILQYEMQYELQYGDK